MEAFSCLGPNTDCYNVDKIIIKEGAIISQKVYLCTASHDFTLNKFPLITAPIEIGEKAWIAANVYIGMGVKIGGGRCRCKFSSI